MQCFLLTKDLMFSSQASGAVSSAGMESKLVSTPEQISEQEPCVVVLDLTMPGLDVDATVAALQKNPAAKLIAVGPHVHAAKLAAAGQAGWQLRDVQRAGQSRIGKSAVDAERRLTLLRRQPTERIV